MKPKLQVLEQEIATETRDGVEYICITDIAKFKSTNRTGVIIGNWLRNRNTIKFLGIWEQLNYPDFKVIELDDFKKEAGFNSFTLIPKQWIEKTDAIKEKLIPESLTPQQINAVYASEADLFDVTAKQWQEINPDIKGNTRDSCQRSSISLPDEP